MAKACIQCGKKIGFFRKPIEAVYCSYDCRNAAREEMDKNQAESRRLEAEAKQRAEQQAAAAARETEARREDERRRRTCPKCGSPWSLTPAAEEGGAHHGACGSCSFAADFTDVVECPNCTAVSLVVRHEEEARCPRCKYRRGSSLFGRR